jgi:oligosaccharide repeat unit polymerase
MNTLIGGVILLILAGINSRVGGSFWYPPALFAALWSVVLLALACSADAFFPISGGTLGVYVLGACAMSVGGAVALFVSAEMWPVQPTRRQWTCRRSVLTGSLILLTALLPLLWYRITQLSAVSGAGSFWVGVRLQTARADVGVGIFEYPILLSTITAWVTFLEHRYRRTSRAQAVMAIALSLAYHLATASRLGALVLIAGLVGIALLHSGHILKPILAGCLAGVAVFVTVALALNKATDSSNREATTASLARSFQLYTLGGVVAFDNVVAGMAPPNSPGRTFRVLYVLANAAGYDVQVPELTSQYAYTPTPTNVYTMYYPYFTDFGPTGVAVLLSFLGWLFTRVYLGARRGCLPFIVGYGLVFSYIVLSAADEYVFSLVSMNVWILLFVFVLYKHTPVALAPQVMDAIDS